MPNGERKLNKNHITIICTKSHLKIHIQMQLKQTRSYLLHLLPNTFLNSHISNKNSAFNSHSHKLYSLSQYFHRNHLKHASTCQMKNGDVKEHYQIIHDGSYRRKRTKIRVDKRRYLIIFTGALSTSRRRLRRDSVASRRHG